MVSKEVTIATVEGELPGILGYGRRHGWSVQWNPEKLLITVEGQHPGAGTRASIFGAVENYRAQPPAWTFGPIPGTQSSVASFPEAGTVDGGIGSIFHPHRIICAPFNLLAYQDHRGPHGDWGGPGNWLQVTGKVTAKTLGDMLAQIVLHLKYSPGWK